MARRRGTALLAVAVALAAAGVAGCGDEDFENEPRPPVVLPVSASIADDSIVVSPATFGAGTARFTIVNLGDSPSVFSIDGPTTAESVEIAPGHQHGDERRGGHGRVRGARRGTGRAAVRVRGRPRARERSERAAASLVLAARVGSEPARVLDRALDPVEPVDQVAFDRLDARPGSLDVAGGAGQRRLDGLEAGEASRASDAAVRTARRRRRRRTRAPARTRRLA